MEEMIIQEDGGDESSFEVVENKKVAKRKLNGNRNTKQDVKGKSEDEPELDKNGRVIRRYANGRKAAFVLKADKIENNLMEESNSSSMNVLPSGDQIYGNLGLAPPPISFPTKVKGSTSSRDFTDWQSNDPDGPCCVPESWGVDLNIIDIPFAELGMVISLGRPVSFIPASVIGIVRMAFISCLQRIFQAPGDMKRVTEFFLLPTILFIDPGHQRRSNIREKCLLVLDDNFSKFTVGSFPGRRKKLRKKSTPVVGGSNPLKLMTPNDLNEKIRRQQVMVLISKGEVSRAFQVLLSDDQIVEPCMENVEYLRSLHPQRINPNQWTPPVNNVNAEEDETLMAIANEIALDVDRELDTISENGNSAVEHPLLTADVLQDIVKHAPNCTAPGVDNFPMDILKALLKTDERRELETDVILFADLSAKFLNLIELGPMNNPDLNWTLQTARLFDGGELILLEKKDTDKKRPIAKATTWRKIWDMADCRLMKESLISLYGNVQLGSQPFGTERAYHCIQFSMQLFPSLDASNMDDIGAFNNNNRHKIMDQVHAILPHFTECFERRLMSEQSCYYGGLITGPELIMSAEGSQQGGPRSKDESNMGSHKHNVALANCVEKNDGIFVAFVDDKNTVACTEDTHALLKLHQEEGPDFGCLMSIPKQIILVGIQESSDEAVRKQQEYCKTFGFLNDHVRIHPRNQGDKDSPEYFDASKLFGSKVMGAPVGTEEYIQHFLTSRIVANMDSTFDKLIERCSHNPQLQYYFLRTVMLQRYVYLCRCLMPSHSRKIAAHFNLRQRAALGAILELVDISDSTIELAMISTGGGLGNFEDIIDPAFVSSIVASLKIMDAKIPGFVLSTHIGEVAAGKEIARCEGVSEFVAAVQRLQLLDPSITFEQLLVPQTDKEIRGLQSKLSAPLKAARIAKYEASIAKSSLFCTIYQSSKPTEARAWLSTLPKSDCTTLDSSQFRTSLRNLLMIAHPLIPPQSICSCGQKMDQLGLHAQKCKLGNDLTIQTHDNVKTVCCELVKHAGIRCKMEVPDFFAAVQHDNADQLRPDLVAYPLGKRKVVYDVRITNAVTAKIQRGEVRKPPDPGIQSLRSEKEKRLKYNSACEEIGCCFVPLVFEVQGTWGKEFCDFFKEMIAQASEHRHIPKGILANYWRRRLSIALQSGVSSAINARAYRIMTNSLVSEAKADESQFRDLIKGHAEAWVNGVNLDADCINWDCDNVPQQKLSSQVVVTEEKKVMA